MYNNENNKKEKNMLKTRVHQSPKHNFDNKNVTNVQRANHYIEAPQETEDLSQTINKLMFIALAITAVTLFYKAISSLML
jgi:hypothetical protein